jgi:uncharacterized protein YndB with AHSA1/START domain
MKNPHGTLERLKDGNYRVRYERHYPHPPDKVWRALIDPTELKHWFPSAIEGERKPGAKLRFVFEGEAGPVTEGVMRVYDPPRVLEFTWLDDLLRFELSPERDGCKLVFFTTFTERVKAPRDSAGWHKCLDALGEKLGAPAPGADEWIDLYRAYASEFGAGEFPSFIARTGILVRDAMQTPGLDGHAFQGHGDARVELLRATRDADTAAHAAAPNEYLFVLEGRYELQLGGGQIALERGMEFAFPEGFSIAGKIAAGTRLLRAVSATLPK